MRQTIRQWLVKNGVLDAPPGLITKIASRVKDFYDWRTVKEFGSLVKEKLGEYSYYTYPEAFETCIMDLALIHSSGYGLSPESEKALEESEHFILPFYEYYSSYDVEPGMHLHGAYDWLCSFTCGNRFLLSLKEQARVRRLSPKQELHLLKNFCDAIGNVYQVDLTAEIAALDTELSETETPNV